MKTPVPSSFSVFRAVTSDGISEENPTWPVANQVGFSSETLGSDTPVNTSQRDREKKEVPQGLSRVFLRSLVRWIHCPLCKVASHAFCLFIFLALVSFPSRRI